MPHPDRCFGAPALPGICAKNDPYSIYDRFDFDIPVGTGEMGTVGDCWDRYHVRVLEMEQSLRIIEQALEGMPDEGDVMAAIPKRIRPKDGELYVRTESPRGELGYFISSDKSAAPFRIKARAPSFVHLSMLPAISKRSLDCRLWWPSWEVLTSYLGR